MYSLDETQYLSLKQGERKNDKKNNIGIAVRCANICVID